MTVTRPTRSALTWPLARASGVKRDLVEGRSVPLLRRQLGQPGPRPKFQVPVCDDGDCYARYPVRVEEMKNSQALSSSSSMDPGGPDGHLRRFGAWSSRNKKDVYGSIEGLIQHFELIMTNRGWKPPSPVYGRQRNWPTANLGTTSSATAAAPLAREDAPPSFINYSTVAKMAEGQRLERHRGILGRLNIVAAELDR